MLCFFQVTKVKPSDKDAKAKYQECNKIVKRIAFEKAIAVEDNKKSIVDALKIENMGNSALWNVFRKFSVCTKLTRLTGQALQIGIVWRKSAVKSNQMSNKGLEILREAQKVFVYIVIQPRFYIYGFNFYFLAHLCMHCRWDLNLCRGIWPCHLYSCTL